MYYPSHTTTVNHTNFQNQQHFPHSQSVVNEVTNTNVGPVPGPPPRPNTGGFGGLEYPGSVAGAFSGPGVGPGFGPGVGPGSGPGVWSGSSPGSGRSRSWIWPGNLGLDRVLDQVEDHLDQVACR